MSVRGTVVCMDAVGALDVGGFVGDVEVLAGRRCAAAEPLAVALVEAWSEPHRRYHTVEHLAACLADASEAGARVGLGEREVALARVGLWFHDAVYDPRRSDNESRSADLAVSSLDRCGVDASVCSELHRLVMVTAQHRYDPADRVAAVVVDADLAVLAAVPASYASYVAGVRAEYAHVPDDVWVPGRGRVLTALAGTLDGVLHTAADPARARAAACRNLDAELNALT